MYSGLSLKGISTCPYEIWICYSITESTNGLRSDQKKKVDSPSENWFHIGLH